MTVGGVVSRSDALVTDPTGYAGTDLQVFWRAVNWVQASRRRSEPTPHDVDALFGRGAPQWHAARASDPRRAARLLTGRAAVRDLVMARRAGRWDGFELTLPGQKPALSSNAADFSIAHSGTWLLAAIVFDGRIGADIEVHDIEFDHPGLIRRMCTEAELESARLIEPELRRAWLARLWTAKEAVTKLDGRGLRQDYRRLELGERVPIDAPGRSIAATLAVSTDSDPSYVALQYPEVGPETISKASFPRERPFAERPAQSLPG